ncbi:MAG: N-acetyltransferase family protein [Clostridia bacterium]|nr:N-acetyltransferase family protein [Clostridia bacterium]
MPDIIIRPATEQDAADMLAVYAPYVENTTVSSEYDAPSVTEFRARIRSFTSTLPWLVCRIDGAVAGYGYASPHRTRAGYQWSVETSIYVAQKYHRCGVARALYASLFELLTRQGYYNIYVGITSPNERSIKFHSAMGFVISGSYQDSMYKFGQWRDVIWMAKSLRTHDPEPRPTMPFPQLAPLPIVQTILDSAARTVRVK